MDELSSKDKEYAGYSEERNTLVKNFMKLHLQKNVIYFTLTNILSFDEKNIEAKKDDVKIKTYE